MKEFFFGIYSLLFKNQETLSFKDYLFFISLIFLTFGIIGLLLNYRKSKIESANKNSTNSFTNFKGKILSLFFILVGTFLLTMNFFVMTDNYNDFTDKKPDTPMITAGNKIIPVELREFTYEKYGVNYSYGELSTEEIANTVQSVSLSPGTRSYIYFEETPNLIYAGYLNQPFGLEKVEDYLLYLPKDSGRYIYEIHAEWDNITANYVFVVEVDEKVEVKE